MPVDWAHPPGSTGLYVRLLQTRGFDQGRQHRESESCAEKAIINGSLLLRVQTMRAEFLRVFK
ncbi:hypothetical protein OUZ56_025409 [Daphnia magna]|uniref:Uncharacterized protein n=1 Tax=Daphnia magna TaxID=35525 RepID=A0ABQ9ZJR8_9CRUS|nr:hypothetical protein OUZ56_025409 [Daphnia magna]